MTYPLPAKNVVIWGLLGVDYKVYKDYLFGEWEIK